MMKNYCLFLLGCCALLLSLQSYAQDTARILLSQENYKKGDSLEFTIDLPNYASLKLKSATAHIWIDDLTTKKRWKFRYPLIEGAVMAALKIGDQVPEGEFAMSCLITSGFYRITGQLTDRDKKDSIINYIMRTSNNKTIVDQLKVDANNNFTMKPMLFQDKASFYFSPLQKTKNNYLAVQLKTPIDSIFEPIVTSTAFFTVGNSASTIKSKSFRLSLDDPEEAGLLPGVTVYTKTKTKVQQYDDQYSSGLFKNENCIIFDGIENDELANSPTLGWFLQQKVPGLTVVTTDDNRELYKWRQGSGQFTSTAGGGTSDPNARPDACTIFIDEFEVPAGDQIMVFPRDIAMLKVFRPPFAYSSTTGFSGAIAIYTKKGNFTNTNGAKFSFILKGYTPFDGVWN
jgi:hypothetical protein